jgi:exopolyphosphatase/guanosine-5'-triphosphate,3'-diphosphate pyrophosphatase
VTRIGAVDIGTNSMRLLIAEVEDGAVHWLDRRTTVTGLGAGVDATGLLAEEAIRRTVEVLGSYGEAMARAGVSASRAVATSAARDAGNRDDFLHRASAALGTRPDVITGEEEAHLAFIGATHAAVSPAPYTVIDIGGGSTEFVFGAEDVSYRVSVDIGSVRLTDRTLSARPAPSDQLAAAQDQAAHLLAAVELPGTPNTVIGVAGTFTSLSAISQDLPEYDPGRVHGSVLAVARIAELVLYLSTLSVEETAAIPSLDPARAPVILSGAVVAEEALRRVGATEVLVSEHDSLDGIALDLANRPAG